MQPTRTRPVPRLMLSVALLAALGLLGAPTGGAASPAGHTGAVRTTAFENPTTTMPTGTSVPDDLRPYQTRTSLLGTHRWYQQVRKSRVVYGGWYVTHTDTQGNVTVWDGRRNVSKIDATSAAMALPEVLDDATDAADAKPSDVADASLVILPSAQPAGEARSSSQIFSRCRDQKKEAEKR